MSAADGYRRHKGLGGLETNVAETSKMRPCTDCILINALIEEQKRTIVEREALRHELQVLEDLLDETLRAISDRIRTRARD